MKLGQKVYSREDGQRGEIVGMVQTRYRIRFADGTCRLLARKDFTTQSPFRHVAAVKHKRKNFAEQLAGVCEQFKITPEEFERRRLATGLSHAEALEAFA